MNKQRSLLSKTLVVIVIILFIGIYAQPTIAIRKNNHSPINTGETLYVDDDNTEGPWDGTINHPFKKIKDGLDNASDGDTVFVFSGSYNEAVRIRNQINLIGENKHTTIIEGNKRHHAIILYDGYITISGFTINNTDDWSGDGGIEIQNAWGTYTTHNTITDNIFKNLKTAIVVYQSPYNTISNNLIYKSGGFSLGSISSYNTVSDNVFNGSGINIWGDPKYFLISGNHITKGGISVFGGKNNQIYNNIIENGKYIISGESTGNVVENNHLMSSDSIVLDGTKKCTVRSNKFTDSRGITIKGKKLEHWNTHTIENNIKNGRPIYYYKDENDIVVPDYTAQVILANCDSCIVKDLVISDVRYGIYIAFSKNINNSLFSK